MHDWFVKTQEIARLGNWDQDPKTGELCWSDQTYRLFGLSPHQEKMTFELFLAMVHQDDRALIIEATDRALASNEHPYQVEYRINLPYQPERIVYEEAHVERDEDGNPTRISGIIQDITERKHAEARDKEEAVRLLLDSVIEGVCGFDENGNCIFCNQPALEMLQYEEQDLIGKRLHELQLHDELDGSALFDQEDTIKTIVAVGKERQTEHGILRRSDGSWFDAEYRVVSTQKKGKTVGAVLTFIDISERKKSETSIARSRAEFQAIFDSISDAIVFVDEQRRIMRINPALQSMFGYQIEDLSGQTTQVLYANPDDYLRQGEQRFSQSAIISQPIFENEYRRSNGECFTGETIGTKVIRSDGQLLGFIGVIRDITKRKQAAEEKSILEAQLHQSHKMEALGTLAGGVAHDFNNMLAIICGNLDVIKKRQKTGRSSEENLEHISRATARAAQLVKQILAFSRQETPELHPVDLCTVYGESLGLLRSTLPSTVQIKMSIACPVTFILADSTQLQQIFFNMCSNAVHAMNEHGQLEISLTELSLTARDLPATGDFLAGRYAKLSISDTGCGMDKETVNRIFEPFFTSKGVGSGTGMGLSVAHGIIQRHGGFVTVDSAPGEGTTFNIYFPVISETGVSDQSQPVTSERLPTGTERILFVDDEECIAEACGEILGYHGYNVTSITSSFDALKLFKASPHEFDLVITDQTMPEMSGTELTLELLKIRPDLPIILCSGYNTSVSELNAKGMGVREYCAKPMDMEQLVTMTRKVLDE